MQATSRHSSTAFIQVSEESVQIMSATEKIGRSIQIAAEYRSAAELLEYSAQRQQDKEQALTLCAAFPDKWSETIVGRIFQVLLIPLMLPFLLLLIYVIAPLVTIFRRGKSAKEALQHGETLMPSNIQSLASASSHTDLYDLWCDHGLPDRASIVSFDVRRECLERWVDTLYGSGMSVVMHVKQRVEDVRGEHAKSAAAFSAQGGHISFIDPVDSVARELARQLPVFRPSPEG